MNCGTAIEWPGTTRYMYSIFVVTKVVAYTHPLRLNKIYCRAQSKRLQKSCKLDTVAFNILISYIDDVYSIGECACMDESFYSLFCVYLNIMYMFLKSPSSGYGNENHADDKSVFSEHTFYILGHTSDFKFNRNDE